jgi:TM2 domain-containing membrane protein YozV
MARIIDFIPELTGEEMVYVQNLMKDMNDEQARTFVGLYRARRKEPNLILVLTLLGLFGLAGFHRMFTDQIVIGLLYFVTVGLCFIGTIIDLVNYQKLTFEFNRKIADEVIVMMR